VQALKAGLLEIADVLVVNKGDRLGADRAMADLTTMLELAAHVGPPGETHRRAPALLRTAAEMGDGVEEVLAALDALRTGPPAERQLRRGRQTGPLLMEIAGARG